MRSRDKVLPVIPAPCGGYGSRRGNSPLLSFGLDIDRGGVLEITFPFLFPFFFFLQKILNVGYLQLIPLSCLSGPANTKIGLLTTTKKQVCLLVCMYGRRPTNPGSIFALPSLPPPPPLLSLSLSLSLSFSLSIPSGLKVWSHEPIQSFTDVIGFVVSMLAKSCILCLVCPKKKSKLPWDIKRGLPPISGHRLIYRVLLWVMIQLGTVKLAGWRDCSKLASNGSNRVCIARFAYFTCNPGSIKLASNDVSQSIPLSQAVFAPSR